jgi:hypothetical protein
MREELRGYAFGVMRNLCQVIDAKTRDSILYKLYIIRRKQ